MVRGLGITLLVASPGVGNTSNTILLYASQNNTQSEKKVKKGKKFVNITNLLEALVLPADKLSLLAVDHVADRLLVVEALALQGRPAHIFVQNL